MMSLSTNPWYLAIRPKTLPASISPILVANLLCMGSGFNLTVAMLTMACALLLQISVNFANDYFDFKSGVDSNDSKERLGPVRATQSGLIRPAAMLTATLVTLAAAILAGAYLIWLGGWPIALIAAASVVGVLWYSGGPFPLASLGLGEITVFLFFGLAAVLGTQFLHIDTITEAGILTAVQMGLLSAAIILVNNIRDIHTDQKAGKRTLSVRLGYRNSVSLYNVLVISPLLIQTYVLITSADSVAPALPFLSLPVLIRLIRHLPERSGRELNSQLADTARYLLIFSLLLSGGLLLPHS